MNREKFKKEFLEELKLFCLVAQRDLKKGFTIEQAEDGLIKATSLFYGARIDFDDYAEEKCRFIATYIFQIIKGNFNEEYLNELCDEIERKKKM